MGLLNEEVKSEEMKDESSLYSKLISSYSKFLRGEELHNFLKKIQSVVSFDDFSLRFSKGIDGANQFIIDIAGVTWYSDKHFEYGDYPHIVTFDNISPDCIKLIHKGTGNSMW